MVTSVICHPWLYHLQEVYNPRGSSKYEVETWVIGFTGLAKHLFVFSKVHILTKLKSCQYFSHVFLKMLFFYSQTYSLKSQIFNSRICFPSLGVSMKRLIPHNKNFHNRTWLSKESIYGFPILLGEKRIQCRLRIQQLADFHPFHFI